MIVSGWGEKWLGRGSGGDGNNLYLERGLGYTCVCICQISKTIHLTSVSFIVCKFYTKKQKNINDTHAEVFGGEWTDVCNLFWNTSKIRWINGWIMIGAQICKLNGLIDE